jgi:hypothetical protein
MFTWAAMRADSIAPALCVLTKGYEAYCFIGGGADLMAVKCGWRSVFLLCGLASVLLATGCGGGSSTASNVTATPSFSPGAGSYNSSQAVTISDAMQGAVLYCTTDGTTPTPSSPQCSQPTTVFQSEFLQAIAVAPGKTASAVMSAGYTINLKAAATPTFSPAGGTYAGTQMVTITDATASANIYYTLDGTIPTTQSTLYTGPVAISASATLSAVATASGYDQSGVESAAYTIQAGGSSPTGSTPAITSLSPASASAGGAAFTLTVNGTNFTSDAAVSWNGTALTTTYGSTTQLTAAVPANLIASAGTATVTVANSIGTSSGASFTINPANSNSPPPSGSLAITSLSPSSASVGGPGFTLTVNGTDFVPSTELNWGNTPLVATFVSSTQLTAAVSASLIATAGTVPITVQAELGAKSAAVNFTVSAGTPAITGLSPSSTLAGGAAFTLTVNGSNFVEGSTVQWGSTALGTTFENPSQLKAAVPASLIATAGTVAVTVTTSGVTSSAANFTVSAPGAPTITSLAPYSVSAGGAAFTLTVGGTNFVSGAVVNWGGTALSTSFGNPTLLTANVPANLITGTGSTAITVSEPAGASGGTSFTVSAAGVPTIASLSPATASAGGPQFTLTVNGENFVSGAVVNWGSTALSTNVVSATQLTATVPANLIASLGSTAITVAESAGTSGIATYNVTVPLPQITGAVVSGAGGSIVPLGGATVQLYAAGSTLTGATGYGQPAIALGSPVTADPQTGAFSVGYDCSAVPPPGDLLYLVATGADNGVVLMTALGPCGGLSTSGTVATINEVTTVASAYSLAQFMTTAPNVGAPESNHQGLVNAFATVNNLVNIATGTALSITPAYASNPVSFLNTSTAPQMRVNTLADILNSCVSTGGSGCTSLFNAAPPFSGAPNTLQAILNIAQNPGVNVTTLFGLASATPFAPALPAAPGDWTLSLTFTGGGFGISPTTSGTDSSGDMGVGPTISTGLAIDANGNIWVTGYGEFGYQSGTLNPIAPILAEFTNQGVPLTSTTTESSDPTTPLIAFGGYNFALSVHPPLAPSSIAVDAAANIWVGDSSGDGNLNTISPGLTPLASADLGSPIYSLAIDTSGNAWIGGISPGLQEFTYSASTGTLDVQALSGVVTAGYGLLTNLVFDSGLNLWGSDLGNSTVDQIFSDGSADSAFPSGGNLQVSLAADNAGNVYGCGDSAGNILDVFMASTSSTIQPAITNSYTLGSRGCGEQLLLDGQGHLFAVSNGFDFFPGPGNVIDEYTITGTLISPPGGYTGTSSAEPPTITVDRNYSPSFFPTTGAIDGSGNLWVINLDTSDSGGGGGTGNVLVEFVGLAAPVVTPTSVALSGQLGTRP